MGATGPTTDGTLEDLDDLREDGRRRYIKRLSKEELEEIIVAAWRRRDKGRMLNGKQGKTRACLDRTYRGVNCETCRRERGACAGHIGRVLTLDLERNYLLISCNRIRTYHTYQVREVGVPRERRRRAHDANIDQQGHPALRSTATQAQNDR